jgi:hypothetical protein
MKIPQHLRRIKGPTDPIPVQMERVGAGEVFSPPTLFDVDVVLDPVDARCQEKSLLPVPRVKGFADRTPIPFFHGVVNPQQALVIGKKLEVVPQFVGQRLPEFFLPVEGRLPLGDRHERSPIEGDDRPGGLRALISRGVRFGQAHPQRVIVRVIRMGLRLGVHDHPIDPLSERRGNLFPHLKRAGLKLREIHARIRNGC